MPKERSILPRIISAAIFILMEVAAVHMLRNNAALQDIWISRGAHKVMSALWGSSESVRQYFSLRKQNDALAAENFALREQLDRYRDLTLPDSLLVRTEGGFSYLPAEVRKVSRNKQHNYMLINKGYEDGVQESSGIITAHGVIGFIDAVEKHLSYARTFMNTDVSISARLGHVGAVGPLVWDGRSTSGAILKEIPLQYKYEPGDTIYTSGYSAIFPPDIPLGVAGESKVINGATNEIRVTLFQDFTALRYVTVVHNNALQEMEALEQ